MSEPSISEALAGFIQSAPVAIALFDRRMRYRLVSQRWLALHQLPPKGWQKRSYYDVHPHIPESWRQAHQRCLTGVALSHDGEWVSQPNGSSQCWRWQMQPWYTQKGDVGGLTVCMEDISDRKQHEADLWQQIAELKQSKQELENGFQERTADLRNIVAQLEGVLLERQHAQEMLAHTLREQESIVSAIPDVLYVLDLHVNMLKWNPRFETVTGFTAEQIRGRSALSFFPEADRQKMIQAIYRAFSVGSMEVESRLIGAGGQLLHYHWNGVILKDEEGNVVGLTGIGRDITDRKQTEETLRQSEERLRTVVANAPLLLWSVDVNGNLTFLEGKGLDALDWKPANVLGHSVLEVYRDFPEILENIWRSLAGERLSFSSPMGKTHFEIYCNPLCNQAGKIIGMIGLAVDISKRVTAEKALRAKAIELEQALHQLKKAQAQLVQTEKMSSLGQLVAGVAHEINNPVNFIYGNLKYAGDYMRDLLTLLLVYRQSYPNPVPAVQAQIDAIELDFIQDDLPRIMASMEAGADRIQKIVLSLRNFSRMDEAAMKIVDIHGGIDSTLLILQHRLNMSSTRPTIEIVRSYGELPLVECYASQLNQVFMNILSNAIDALDEAFSTVTDPPRTTPVAEGQPTIWIQTEFLAGRSRVAIRIRDNGPGISEAAKVRLFDPFYTTKPVGKGTGLGLSICYQVVVQQHGGILECCSGPDEGAEFLIEIPCRQTPHES